MPSSKKPAKSSARVTIKDLKSKKDPKGGTTATWDITTNKADGSSVASWNIVTTKVSSGGGSTSSGTGGATASWNISQNKAS